jgi:methylmalonyl-CoA/ethylmalonyl-CoA epimerase
MTDKKGVKEFGLGTLRQIGIVVRDTDKALNYYEKTLGIGRFDSFISERETKEGKAKLRYSVAQVGAIQIEVIEVVEGETIHSQFLKKGREGLHHIGFFVDDLDKKLKELQQRGVKVLERAKVPLVGIEYAYLDTESISGVIFELIKNP